MTALFRYPDKDWRAIEACLTKLTPDADAHLGANWRHTIEDKVRGYLWRTARYDPRSPEVIAEKACWARIAKLPGLMIPDFSTAISSGVSPR